MTEKNGKKEKKENKIMTFLVASNVIASRPPERRPTGTLTARAKCGGGPNMPLFTHNHYISIRCSISISVIYPDHPNYL